MDSALQCDPRITELNGTCVKSGGRLRALAKFALAHRLKNIVSTILGIKLEQVRPLVVYHMRIHQA